MLLIQVVELREFIFRNLRKRLHLVQTVGANFKPKLENDKPLK
jgi:hypothetical protein